MYSLALWAGKSHICALYLSFTVCEMRPVQAAHSFVARHTCLIIGLVDALMHFPDPSFRTKHSFPRLLEHWLLVAQSWGPPQELPAAEGNFHSQDCTFSRGAAPSNSCPYEGTEAGPPTRFGTPRSPSQQQSCPRDQLRTLLWLHCSPASPSAQSCNPCSVQSLNLTSLPFKLLCVNFSKSVSKENWPKTIGETTCSKLKFIS